MDKIVACWHHRDEERLLKHLKLGRIDLYGKNERTEKGTNRLEYWWRKMRLHIGDRIRIVVDKNIIAEATINSGPYDLMLEENYGMWGSAVNLTDIEILSKPYPTASCAGYQGSHRFDGPKTSKLKR